MKITEGYGKILYTSALRSDGYPAKSRLPRATAFIQNLL